MSRNSLTATYLGWQGWLLSGLESSVIVDPLLHDDTGRGPAEARASFMLWPPRVTSWDQTPPVDAMLISHEHDDHFDVRSIAHVSRRVRILLSGRSSVAASSILNEMGFERIDLVYPGDVIEFGDLRVRIYGPDHLATDDEDEWDVVAYLIEDRVGNAFFTNVDIGVTDPMRAALRARGDDHKRTLCFHDLAICTPEVMLAKRPPPGSSVPTEAPPVRIESELAASLLLGRRLMPVPGDAYLIGPQGFSLTHGTNYVSALARDEWPPRPGYWPAKDARMAPVIGGRTCSDTEFVEIGEALDGIARFIYGGPLFRALYSLPERSSNLCRQTFAWIMLLDEELECIAYEYDASRCAFRMLDDATDIEDRYLGLIVTWATDFLALSRGEIEPRNIVRGYRETWKVQLGSDLFVSVLWKYFHPLRHPERVLEQYRRVAEQERSAPEWIRPR